MFKFSVSSIATAINGINKNIKDNDMVIDSAVINNREVKKNCCFIAIKGKNFNANKN